MAAFVGLTSAPLLVLEHEDLEDQDPGLGERGGVKQSQAPAAQTGNNGGTQGDANVSLHFNFRFPTFD